MMTSIRRLFNCCSCLCPLKQLQSNDPRLEGTDTETEVNKDLISQLPDEILHLILSFLTIISAGKTSILSKRWRYVWSSTPVLKFIQPKFAPFPKSPSSIRKFVKLVDTVISLHDGSNIHEFVITWHHGFDIVKTTVWLNYAIDHKVRCLNLDIRPSEKFSLPHTLFCCPSLESLTIVAPKEYEILGNIDEECKWISFTDSTIQLPTKQLLNNLRTMKFMYMDSPNNSLGKLVSDCYLLASLYMTINRDNIEISAPKLTTLTLNCSCHCGYSIVKICAPKVVTFTCYFSAIPQFHISGRFQFVKDVYFHGSKRQGYVGNMVHILQSVSNAKTLKLTGSAFQMLPKMTDLSNEMFSNFCNLKYLMIKTPLTKDNIQIILMLLEKFPTLENLFIGDTKKCNSPEAATEAEDMKPSMSSYNCNLNILKEIEISDFVGDGEEIDLLNSLLKNGKALQKVNINYKNTAQTEEEYKKVSKMLLAIPRASSKAIVSIA